MRERHIIVDNLDISYIEQGSGPVVLLLHGWGTNLRTFDALTANWVGDRKRVIALDLPGFGNSEHPSVAWDVSAYASFVRNFLMKLGVDTPNVLIGHSLGGRIAIKGVADGILRPEKLVLIAAAGTAGTNTIRNVLFLIVAKVGKFFVRIPPLSFFKSKLRKKLYAAAGSTDYLHAGTMKDTFLNVVRENLENAASRIQTPTLIVWGEHDMETPISEAHTLHAVIRNSTLTIIEDSGHFVHEEKPNETAQALVSFTAL